MKALKDEKDGERSNKQKKMEYLCSDVMVLY